MLTKNKIKFINSLSTKKNRIKHNLFLAEGVKIINDLINSDYKIVEIFSTNTDAFNDLNNKTILTQIDSSELKKISQLSTPNMALALVEIPEWTISTNELENELTIVLDTIQDPGNFGTIIRIANWFGITQIICSNDSVDVFNPKVIQSTMGAFTLAKVIYQDLESFLSNIAKMNIPVYGTLLEGENIYNSDLSKNGLILFGNESKGLNKEYEKFLTHKLHIPSFSKNSHTDSLNIATAASIVCSEFKRRS